MSIFTNVGDCLAVAARIILFIFSSLMVLTAIFEFSALFIYQEIENQIDVLGMRIGSSDYVVAMIRFCLGLLGCHGAFAANAKHLKYFALSITIFATLTLVMDSMSRLMLDLPKVEGEISDKLAVYAKEYQIDAKPGDNVNNATRTWDLIQRHFHCCGLNSPKDWMELNSNVKADKYPRSCCYLLTRSEGAYKDGKCRFEDEVKTRTGCLEDIEGILGVSAAIDMLIALKYIVMAYIACIIAKHAEPDINLNPFNHQKLNEFS